MTVSGIADHAAASSAGNHRKPAPERLRSYVRTPAVPQMEAADCAAACLTSVLAAHGRRIPLSETRRTMDLGRDGASMADLGRAAARYGLTATARLVRVAAGPTGPGDGKTYLDRVSTAFAQVPMPAVVFLTGAHFAVLEGIKRGRVHLNDPSVGHLRLTPAEFAARSGGVAVVLRRTPGFTAGGPRLPTLRALGRRAAPFLAPLLLVALLGVLAAVPAVGTALIARTLVIRVLLLGQSSWTPLLICGLLGAAAVGFATVLLQRLLLARVLSSMARRTSGDYLWRLLRLPGSFVHRRHLAALALRVQTNDGLSVLVADQLTSAAAAAVIIAVDVVVLALLSVPLAIVAAVLAVSQLVALQIAARRRAAGFQRVLAEELDRDTVAHGGLTMIESLKAEAAESWFFARWSQAQSRALSAAQELAVRTQTALAVPAAISSVGTVATMLVGISLLRAGRLELGTLIAAQTMLGALLAPVGQLVSAGSDLQQAQAQVSVLADVDEAIPDPDLEPSLAGIPVPVRRLTGRIDFHGVTFRYGPHDEPAVDDVSFSVLPGQRVSIVGSTGSGKSTMARLLTGAVRPAAGQILLDGVPREEWPRTVLTGSLAYVEQHLRLFDGSVTDNLTGWDGALPLARIQAALDDAEIAALVRARGGLDAEWISDQGRTLSGGEKQRLEIARALAGDPTVLVLDEATSALDAEVERRVDANIRARGITTVVIAHRLSTVRDSDLIIVLQSGRITQQGTHADLVGVPGHYRDLVEGA